MMKKIIALSLAMMMGLVMGVSTAVADTDIAAVFNSGDTEAQVYQKLTKMV